MAQNIHTDTYEGNYETEIVIISQQLLKVGFCMFETIYVKTARLVDCSKWLRT